MHIDAGSCCRCGVDNGVSSFDGIVHMGVQVHDTRRRTGFTDHFLLGVHFKRYNQ